MFVLMATTGLRLGELLALRWQNIDLDERRMSITHSLWRKQLVAPKTAASKKSFRLHESLGELLRVHVQSAPFRERDDFVFARIDGSPLDPAHLRNKVLYPALDAAGIRRVKREYGFQILRHSAGSILYDKTRDLKVTQQMLRHSQVGTTADIYVHPDEEVLVEGMDILVKEIDLALTLPNEAEMIN